MINLPTGSKLAITASVAGSLDCYASFVDFTTGATAGAPGAQPTAVTTTSGDIVAATAVANTIRNVKGVTIRNKGAAVVTVTVTVVTSTPATFELRRVQLGAGDTLIYDEGAISWQVVQETSAWVNRNAVDQLLTAATILPITNSNLDFTGVKVGTIAEWTLTLSKGATGTAAATFGVYFGTTGSAATDTLRSASFTTGTQTAVADAAEVQITACVRTTGASGIVHFKFELKHNLATTGLSNQQIIVTQAPSAGFDLTVSSLKASIGIVSGTASSITVNRVRSERTDP